MLSIRLKKIASEETLEKIIVKSTTGLPTSPYHYSSNRFLKSLLTSVEVDNWFVGFIMGELGNGFAEFIIQLIFEVGSRCRL